MEKVKVLGKERKTVAELAPGWELRMDFELGLLTEAKRALGLVLSLVVLKVLGRELLKVTGRVPEKETMMAAEKEPQMVLR